MQGPKWPFLLILIVYESDVVSGYPTSTSIPQVDGLSTDPRVLGRHSLVSERRYTST